MLTVKEASEELRVSASLVYTLCARGRISHYRCGLQRGTIRISKEALQAYLDQTKVTIRERPQGLRKNFSQLNSARLAEAWKRQGVL
jgi:excisionase family DNA binding protein